MIQRYYVRLMLVIGFFAISLGGLLAHAQVHPFHAEHAWHYVPFVAGIFGITFLTVMFCFSVTIPYAYVLNGMVVIFGTITMAHFSLALTPLTSLTVRSAITGTTFPYILILWTNFALGKAIFELSRMRSGEERFHQGRFFRYPNMGWWLVHVVAISTVYYLGHTLWP